MNIVFYDFETTGRKKWFDQIIEVGAILVDGNLNEKDRIQLRCRIKPGVVPSAEALLINKTSVSSLLKESCSHYQMIEELRSKFLEWSPAIFVGWNTIKFDEDFLRQALFQNLRSPYLTNTHGNQRADIFPIAHAMSVFSPNSIVVPRKDDGKPSFKLEDIAPANGITDFEAHSAIGDVKASIELAKLCREKAPAVWGRARIAMDLNKIKETVQKEKFFCFFTFFFNKPQVYAGAYAGKNKRNEKEIALFDLKYDPEELFDSSVENLKKEITGTRRKIRTISINKFPILMEGKYAENNNKEYRDIGVAVLEERAQKVRENQNFHEKVGEALALQLEERIEEGAQKPKYLEERLYDGFASKRDEYLEDQFHEAQWDEKLGICSDIEDDRLRRYGKRMIFYESPDSLPPKVRKEVEEDIWMRARGIDEGDESKKPDNLQSQFVKCMNKLDDLRVKASQENDEDKLDTLDEIDQFYIDLQKQYENLS